MILIVFTPLFFVPSLSLKASSTDPQAHEEPKESYTAKNTES